jgi:hypothetical protein
MNKKIILQITLIIGVGFFLFQEILNNTTKDDLIIAFKTPIGIGFLIFLLIATIIFWLYACNLFAKGDKEEQKEEKN